MTSSVDDLSSRGLCWFLYEGTFWANFTNVLLCAGYAWTDYGRGFLELHPSLIDVLFIFLAFSYVLNAIAFIAIHAGEMPWPSGWTMLGEWLSLLGSICFAITSIMYLDRSGAHALPVLLVEASGSLVYAAAAIVQMAGGILEAPLKIGLKKKSTLQKRIVRYLSDPYMWAYLSNFIPAMVYLASNLTAAELHFAREASDVQDADMPQFSGLLRQLSRIYWYGDIIWLINSIQWLVLYFTDAYESDKPLSPNGDIGEVGATKSVPSSPLIRDLMWSLRDGPSNQDRVSHDVSGGLQMRLLEEDSNNGGLVPILQPIPTRLRRRRPERRWHIKDTTPYPIFGTCIRSWDLIVGPLDKAAAADSAPVDAAAESIYLDESGGAVREPPVVQGAHNSGSGGTLAGRVSSGRVLRLAMGSMVAVSTVQGQPIAMKVGGGAGLSVLSVLPGSEVEMSPMGTPRRSVNE